MSERIKIGRSEDFMQGEKKPISVNGKALIVVRTADRICAVLNRCSHMPLPIAGGKVEDDTIVCPWHNSKFDLCSGENMDWVPGVAGVKIPKWTQSFLTLGKKPTPLTTFAIIEEDGQVYVEMG